MVEMSCHKFASNIVEKVLSKSDGPRVNQILRVVLGKDGITVCFKVLASQLSVWCKIVGNATPWSGMHCS